MTISTGSPTSSARSNRRGLTQAIRRLGWGVADQGISSLSNFALGLFVARSFGAHEFGAFTLAFLTYSLVINAARGLATDPFLVRHSGEVSPRWRLAASSATGTALAVGLVTGILCVVTGLLLPHPLGLEFVALGVGLPGLALQDSWRFAFFASGRGAHAFLNDLVWGVLLVLALTGLYLFEAGSSARCLLAFGATATLAAVLGGIQAKVIPRPARAVQWLREHYSLSLRYLAVNVTLSGASQLRSSVLGGVAGLAAVGYVRASEILMGPFLVVLMGISQVAVPEAARVLVNGVEPLRRFCLGLGAVQAIGAVAWGVILLTVFPLGPGPALLDELWIPAAQLVPPVTLAIVASSFITGANAGLRAMGAARRSLRSQLITSGMFLVGSIAGAIVGGAVGTSWGMALAYGIGLFACWHQLRLALAEHSQAAVAK